MLVDYQLPTDPANIRIAKLIRDGGLGKIAKLITVGINGGRPDPVWSDTIENRLEKGTWNNTISIGGDFVVSYDIHAIDAAVWLLGERPISAMGFSRICRPNPNGDSHDASSIIFEYADGIIHEHSGLSLPTGMHDELSCSIHGQTGRGVLNYMDKARFQPRGKKAVVLDVADLYKAGAVRNIGAFYDNVMNEKYDNPTVRRAVDGCLTCILGRDSAIRRSRLTMDELLKANKRVETNLSGLKS